MKLYNLYKEVILEESNKSKLLLEATIDDIKSAMDNKVNVNIYYESPDGKTTKRYIQIYDVGYTKAGNLAIQAWQLAGSSDSGKDPNNNKTGSGSGYGWRLFRVDKIKSVEPTGFKYHRRIDSLPSFKGQWPNWNAYGNKNMTGTIEKVKFDNSGKYSPERKIPDELKEPFDNDETNAELAKNDVERRLRMPYNQLPSNSSEDKDEYK